ncbi:hypothetical protein GGX14DRAFT_389286 [Mycena pura]|uniref:Uncharacterized protein n=1 Tax=Mycena pura TaxID=153505 RepID=A0AAD6YJ34_9AGAR|nr:hypothetical protein GGX14DRAFT_389286 [Mycena pura]
MVYYSHTDDNGPRWPSWNATTRLSIAYIREPVIPKSNCSDPLVWWATMSPYSSPPARKNVNNKGLIQMAQDFLSGPPVPLRVPVGHLSGLNTCAHPYTRRYGPAGGLIRGNQIPAGTGPGFGGPKTRRFVMGTLPVTLVRSFTLHPIPHIHFHFIVELAVVDKIDQQRDNA